MVRRFEVYLVQLNPTRGSEIRKTRPCVVVSPDEMHQARTVMIAPLTGSGKDYPSRIPVRFQGRDGFIVLDQLRTVDRVRLVRHLGELDQETGLRALAVLRQIFEP